MPGGKPRKARPYLIPLSLAMIVVAGLIPDPQANRTATNDQVAAAAEGDNGWDRASPAEAITLHIDRGVVRMSRVVPRLLVRHRAEDDEDRHAPPATRRQLLRAIEAALIRKRAVDSGDVTVTAAKDGMVTLTGDVQSAQEKRRAGEAARSVRGVQILDNRLSVRAAAALPDRKIESDIGHRLARDPQVDRSFIRIAVTNGMVTLSGAVGTAAEKRRAVEDAWVAGVRHVEASKLSVEAWAQVYRRNTDKHDGKYATTDAQIEHAPQRANLPAPPATLRNFWP